MGIVVTETGDRMFLNDLTDSAWAWYHLYMAPATLTTKTVASDLTEVVAPWYAPIQVMSWSDAMTVGDHAEAYADPVIWTVGAVVVPLDVYGYYVTVGQTGSLVLCETSVPGPVPMRRTGAVCAVFPRLTTREDPFPV